jgi:serine/threonine protein kinase
MMLPTLVCKSCGADNQSQATYCQSCGSSLQAVRPTIFNSATGRLMANILLKQRYRIIAPIGKGGMGAVYKAEDTQLGSRLVALKEMSQSGLSSQEQQEAADAFKREAMMLARLQHPNLPSIFDHFEENGRWYLVMSFIAGETLENYLSKAINRRLSLGETLQIGMQLCTVLDYLHNQQPAIIFRDLKPANIMRTPNGHIYLIDFGIARHFKPGQVKDTAYSGSMGYAPPEQYGQAQTNARSDIYSLGVVLYEMLSGHNPSTTPFQFPSLQSQVPTVPMKLATLITQMLEMDKNKRPVSVQIVSQKLQSLIASPPGLVLPVPLLPTVAVGSPPVFPPTSSRRGRRWLVLLVGMLGLISVASGLVYFASSSRISSNSTPIQTLPATSVTPTQSLSATSTSQPSTVYPRLASSYQGFVHNTASNQTATLTLTSIVQNQQVISGNVIIGAGLFGSGPFTGTISTDRSVNFTDLPTDGASTIVFSGSLHTDGSLSGTYVGQAANTVGTWQTTPL